MDGSCQLCAAGFFKEGAGNDECVECDAGTSSDSSDTTKCVACDANTYCTGGAPVENCTANSASPSASDSINDCTCNTGYTDYGERCVPEGLARNPET